MSEFEHELPPVLKRPPPPVPPPPATSLIARLMNIFAMPGRVFDEVRHVRHRVGNWLLPTVLCAIALGFSGYVLLSMPSAWKEVSEQQAKIRERQASSLAESVQAGKITQDEADKTLKLFDTLAKPAVMKSAASAGGFIFGFLRVFWWAFVLWLLARSSMRARIGYGKALEVAGLSSMIALLNTVVLLVLAVNVGQSFGASGFALSVSDLAALKNNTLVAIILNLVNFWLIGVLGTGLSRLTGAPWFRAVLLVMLYWIVSDFMMLMLGVGLRG